MARASQGVKLKLASNQNAKYKLTYKYSYTKTTSTIGSAIKYTFSKLITPTTKKYSYN